MRINKKIIPKLIYTSLWLMNYGKIAYAAPEDIPIPSFPFIKPAETPGDTALVLTNNTTAYNIIIGTFNTYITDLFYSNNNRAFLCKKRNGSPTSSADSGINRSCYIHDYIYYGAGLE